MPPYLFQSKQAVGKVARKFVIHIYTPSATSGYVECPNKTKLGRTGPLGGGLREGDNEL